LRVALFTTCLIGEIEGGTGRAAARVLHRLGVDVVVPRGQTCCGQPAFNSGHRAEARRIAAHTLAVLESAEFVVLPSGSCTAMIRHHFTGLVSDTEQASLARSLAGRTYELCEFIVRVLGHSEIGTGLTGRTVAYHHGCHALRELNVREEPLLLLRNAGASLVDWQAAEECCGFGGLFSVKMPEVSVAMADRKLDTMVAVRPDVITSADTGCLLQLRSRAERRGIATPFRHVAHLLVEAADGRS